MNLRKQVHRLRLGPIVGHTSERSVVIWIRVFDDPAQYTLRIEGHGVVPFESTERGVLEFHTATARADGLRSNWQYRYRVFRHGRAVRGSTGSFRTMPHRRSMTPVTFVTASCNHQEEEGAWADLSQFIEDAKPRFLLMIGDQVYLDDSPNLWRDFLESPRPIRRQAMADAYQESWSRDIVRHVLANIPTYMMWDDHEIRDGWGSWAGDSPTLAASYPRGQRVFDFHNAYFEDARDVFWHFQMSHNPPFGPPPQPGQRRAMPVFFYCGRLLVLLTDCRGDRDLWRETHPVLGNDQWDLIDALVANIPPEVEAIAVATAAPIASMSPTGLAQLVYGRRTDDVELFKKGSSHDALRSGRDFLEAPHALRDAWLLSRFGVPSETHAFRLQDIDDVRDQWSHHVSRPEQEKLIRKFGEARLDNRSRGTARRLIFLGGDIHAGGIFDIEVSKPEFTAPCLISSGISQQTGREFLLGLLVDEEFEVADGIHSRMREFVNEYNFGIVHMIPTGATPELIPTVAHAGNSRAVGIRRIPGIT